MQDLTSRRRASAIDGKPNAYKVRTRHFHYTRDFCTVIIAVTDLDPTKQLAERIKE